MHTLKNGFVISVIAIALLAGCVSSSKYRALEASSKAEQSKSQQEIEWLKS